MPRAYCWRCGKYVNAAPSGSDIMGGVIIPGPGPFNLIAPIRKRYQEHFCPLCGTRVGTEDQISDYQARRQPILSPISVIILAVVLAVTLLAFVVVMISDCQNQGQATHKRAAVEGTPPPPPQLPPQFDQQANLSGVRLRYADVEYLIPISVTDLK